MSLMQKLSQSASKIIALLIAVLVSASSAQAHGIAGNRYFPGTLTFDDPAVADELFIPLYSHLEHPTRERATLLTTLSRSPFCAC
jgi:hypothetical protein